MTDQIDKFAAIVNRSKRILVTSHISPDPDAVSSLTLMNETLKQNFPDKNILAILEEEPTRLNFIPGYNSIRFQPLDQAVTEFKPELIILLDGNNYERFSRHNGQSIRQKIADDQIKTVIIDHHELTGKDDSDVYINQNSPASASEVYKVCFEQLGWQKPSEASEITMIGLYADSGGFIYLKDGVHSGVFELVAKLLEDGVKLERIKNQLTQFSSDDISALNALFTNTKSEGDYTYSYLDDDFISDWLAKGHTYSDLQIATGRYLDDYVRNVEGRKWGFIVYRNKLQGDDYFSVSFRSVGGIKDVAELATKLGGGGHKPAAGAKFKAGSLEGAIDKVKKAITSN
jgi:phosphoesterase RecJ-like protein